MIERQLNDTRYISKFISSVLSNIVREETNDDGVNSKNILPVNGKITTTLKQDWGLNDVWNDLILSRFVRMNTLTNSTAFTAWNEQYQKFLPTVPLELSKGFQKKRIDHRHHAMDALIIACATRDHINLLNNQSAKSDISRYDLQNKLRNKEKESYFDNKENKQITRDIFKEFKKPWGSFTVDAQDELGKIVVSFKQNLRVINKTTNKYQTYEHGKKVLKPQQKGDSWAIRKPLHKDTVYAKVSLRKIKNVRFSEALKDWKMIVNKELKHEIKRLITLYGGEYKIDVINKYFKDRKYLFNEVDIAKVDVYYFEKENAAVRKSLDASFTEKTIKDSVTDTGIQKILLNHLAIKENRPDMAFSPEGIEELNQNIVQLNNGKFHQPIYKVRIYEPIGNKFSVGYRGNKTDKYVEAAKGTNLFFAIYADENGHRSFETIPLNIVIERMKQGLNAVPETNEKGYNLLFHLSPNDLVYVPTEDERENIHTIDWEKLNKEQICNLYKIVSFTNSRLYATPVNVAISIVNKAEFTHINKIEYIEEKKYCVKLKINRVGNIFLENQL
jgi:CRISPR-associated endonuclease Csn1